MPRLTCEHTADGGSALFIYIFLPVRSGYLPARFLLFGDWLMGWLDFDGFLES